MSANVVNLLLALALVAGVLGMIVWLVRQGERGGRAAAEADNLRDQADAREKAARRRRELEANARQTDFSDSVGKL